MKIRLHLKAPDSIEQSVRDFVNMQRPDDVSDEDWAELEEDKINETTRKLSKWVEFRENLSIEIDMDLETATVLKVK